MNTPDNSGPLDEEGAEGVPNPEISKDIPLYGCRSISPDEEICIPCGKVLYHLVHPALRPGRRSHYDSRWSDTPIGWVDRLIATSRCLLCQFFVRMLFTCSPSVKQETYSAECRFMLVVDNTQEKASPLRSSLSDITLRYDKHIGPLLERQPVIFVLERGVMSFAIASESIDHLFELVVDHRFKASAARAAKTKIPPKVFQAYCDLDNLRSLYDNCRQSHGTECESIKPIFVGKNRLDSILQSPGSVEHILRLIDVSNMNLVKCQADEYFALSYCWSTQQYETLTRSNITKLQTPGGLASHLLPPTICDAINLTKALGKTYLWVDALCIIQDSMEDKALYVSRMDSIYEQAALTIVAAASQDASHDPGLPGVYPRTRLELQNVVTTGKIHLIQRLPRIDTAIDESRWSSRAWTFQEYIFSKRIILFSPAQFYFTCRCDGISEENFYESKGQHPPQDQLSRRATSYRFYHYGMIAAAFSKRRMSYQHDGLNAFRGLVNAMASEEGVKFLCGIPIPRLFEQYLLWHHRTPNVRRGLTAKGMHFPSWAWVGWVGEVDFHDYSYSSEEERWVARAEETLVKNYTIEFTDSKGTTNNVRPSDLDHSVLVAIESCLLCFKTERAYLQVSNEGAGDFRRHFSNGCYPIMVEGKFAGIFLPMTPAEGNIQQTKHTKIEFIALSYGYGWNTTVLVDKLNLKPEKYDYVYVNDDGEREYNTRPYDVHKWDNSYGKRCVNILYIQWQGSHAQRCGIGQIHEDAWMKEKREEINVRLG